jgi:hypothetical protein
MIFSRNLRPVLKRALPLAFCLSFLLVNFIPSTGFAIPIVSSTGSIGLDTLTFSFTGPVGVSFLDADGANTKSSFSSAWAGLNGTNFDGSDFVEGAFTTTSFTALLPDASGQVAGSGATTASSASASSNIALNSGPSLADVFIAQSALTGQFTVDGATQLTVTANYSYTQSLNSVGGGSAFSDILAGIYLFDFDTDNQIASNEFSLVNSIIDLGSFTSANGGVLSFVVGLLPTFTYAFEASASTVASATAPAPVPEPATMLLLGAGLIGIGFYSRRFKMDR